MQQVRNRMVGAQSAAARTVNPELDGVALMQGTVGHFSQMDMELARLFYRVVHRQFGAGAGKQDAGVADLPAGFAIKRGLIDDYSDLVSGGRLAHALS